MENQKNEQNNEEYIASLVKEAMEDKDWNAPDMVKGILAMGISTTLLRL